ncbi:hypothetical protein AVEN_167741-1 [Araneus ventricosus]|uniref:Uncharacterized protein n=1 Tax=Araneus ventricosus TaxID=182803 RepID=A0A4Y2I307_ARAVE|nr:hypothetical protein AVEN_167741-1 [Araneus ventricosus]
MRLSLLLPICERRANDAEVQLSNGFSSVSGLSVELIKIKFRQSQRKHLGELRGENPYMTQSKLPHPSFRRKESMHETYQRPSCSTDK